MESGNWERGRPARAPSSDSVTSAKPVRECYNGFTNAWKVQHLLPLVERNEEAGTFPSRPASGCGSFWRAGFSIIASFHERPGFGLGNYSGRGPLQSSFARSRVRRG